MTFDCLHGDFDCLIFFEILAIIQIAKWPQVLLLNVIKVNKWLSKIILPFTNDFNTFHADATIYAGGLDDKVSETLLWELFVQAGPVGKSKGGEIPYLYQIY